MSYKETARKLADCEQAIHSLKRMPRKNEVDYEKLHTLEEYKIDLEHELEEWKIAELDDAQDRRRHEFDE